LWAADLAGANLAGADRRDAEIAGLNLMTLGSMKGLKVSQHQQWVLLAGLGVEVDAD
jgi:hypothetical protein